MPTFTKDVVPTDPQELAFLRQVLHAAGATNPFKRKRNGQFAPSHSAWDSVSTRQHVLASLPLAQRAVL
jgi:hypothetical protein